MGTIFWNMTNIQKLPPTGMHANELNSEMPFLDAYMHNMGLCMNPTTMLNKFLIAIAFSEYIGDSPPDEAWYEDAWLNFDFDQNNHDLEMSLGYRDDLPVAYEYNLYEWPESIRKKMESNIVRHWKEFHMNSRVKYEKEISPIILSKLGGTEELNGLLTRYINIHKKIMSNTYNNSMEEKEHRCSPIQERYVIVRDWEETGFGNRIQSIVSAFLFALITDRALLIDWPDEPTTTHWNKEELVAMKSISNFFENPDFDWNYANHKQHFEGKITIGNLTDTKVTYPGMDGKSFYKGYRGIEESFQCGDYNIEFTESIVSIRADNYFALNIAINPLYRHFVQKYFKNDIFGPLSRFLFRPVKSIQTEIDDFKKNHFGKFTLGLQIRRVGGSKLNSGQEDIFWKCTEELTAIHHNTTIWFLTTDNEETRKNAKEKYGSQLVYYDKPISRADVHGLVGGVIDMWLLSDTDDMIVSAASTYGRISYGMKGRAPKYVNRKNECKRKDSSQPCFFKFNHYKNKCFTKEMETSLSEFWRNEINTDCDQV